MKPAVLAPACARGIKAQAEAWNFFQAQPPSYRRTSVFWVFQAKREETRHRRFEILLACAAARQPIPLLARGPRR